MSPQVYVSVKHILSSSTYIKDYKLLEFRPHFYFSANKDYALEQVLDKANESEESLFNLQLVKAFLLSTSFRRGLSLINEAI